MNKGNFVPKEYYKSYPSRVISRPGYPARAAFKSTFMFRKYGRKVLGDIGLIKTYADIGGCFGFGANSMKFQISRQQKIEPETSVFEISSDFTDIGKLLFPSIEFINDEFNRDIDIPNRYDLVTLFDVVEHISEPHFFLNSVSERCKYAMLIVPLETSGEWRGCKPPIKQGAQHRDGHVNFFNSFSYEKLLENSGFDIISCDTMHRLSPLFSFPILEPEAERSYWIYDVSSFIKNNIPIPFFSWKINRKIFGNGIHVSLCRSKKIAYCSIYQRLHVGV